MGRSAARWSHHGTASGDIPAPAHLEVLPGDTVVWSNADAISHTVTGDEGGLDADYPSSGTTFALTFSKLGRHAYHCSIHRFMHGVVAVVPVSLSCPGGPVVSGGRVVLRGLAPTGTPRATVARSGPAGHVERRVVPACDGSFAVTVRVFGPELLVARVTSLASTPVRVSVAPHVLVPVRDRTLTAAARALMPSCSAMC